ncbi:DUF397 domain-containing protein [Streptomyces sp. NPDC002812]|uniref:DUF397 domain-containing protein n=1 Tax=Streptomyces sp. NPDC002812 TaxID=3154434 RepID=UPI0033338D16
MHEHQALDRRSFRTARGKSSYSASDSNDCVEIAVLPEAILVRDSKDIARDHLAVNPAA